MLEPVRDQDLKNLFQKARTIAVVGAKDKAGQPVDMVGRYLIAAGYQVVPVHPVRQNVWGLETWKSILDIPFAVDIVDLFRAARYCPEHAREVMALSCRPSAFWMQSGIRSLEAEIILKKAQVLVVQDMCIKTQHLRLMGSQT
ncbi:CoA-binding protein [Desulfonatronovibrio hydrogenovorans]|uniref:CoA-binding protein n=1 Tax=Desulfonatronovibrio hydrogenovorans TaxID=53245 RepID=UPI0004903F22|nr:CoA-binding protein [Desulfonatronovibrio hydrogenovorans]